MISYIRPVVLIVGIVFIAAAIQSDPFWESLLFAVIGGSLVGFWEAWFKDAVR